MYEFEAHRFLQFAANLESLEGILGKTEDKAAVMPPDFKRKVVRWCVRWEANCQELGLTMAVKTIQKIRILTAQRNAKLDQFVDLTKELKGRLIDQAEATLFLGIEPSNTQFYKNTDLFGNDVAMGFPSTMYDIEEAGKCLALNRATACVFHLMRVLEIGLRALGASLKDASLDPGKNPTWVKILRRCRGELEKDAVDRTPEWRKDESFYSDAAARLMAVKDAWRNPTMHVRAKYTEEEALDIWNHVKAFMAHLATKLQE